ncbi:MAG: amidase family protein, partial [Steroidobacteraceae bacterium]
RDPESRLEPVADYLDLGRPVAPGIRVAVCRRIDGFALTNCQTGRALDNTAQLLRDLGCEVRDDDPPLPAEADELLQPGVWGYCGDHYAAAESMVPGFWENHANDLTDYTRPIYDAGRTALAWQYRRLMRRTRAYREQVAAWFVSYDFLITPVAGPAPLHDTDNDERKDPLMRFLAPFNTARNPAAAVPVDFHADGLPLALQIVGRAGDDLGVLRLSEALQASRPPADRWPALANVTP